MCVVFTFSQKIGSLSNLQGTGMGKLNFLFIFKQVYHKDGEPDGQMEKVSSIKYTLKVSRLRDRIGIYSQISIYSKKAFYL